jgi:hypothetical protein
MFYNTELQIVILAGKSYGATSSEYAKITQISNEERLNLKGLK